jgi:hypothetical protein
MTPVSYGETLARSLARQTCIEIQCVCLTGQHGTIDIPCVCLTGKHMYVVLTGKRSLARSPMNCSWRWRACAMPSCSCESARPVCLRSAYSVGTPARNARTAGVKERYLGEEECDRQEVGEVCPADTHSPPVRFSGPWIATATPAINEGCTRSLRVSHTSRRAPLQPVPKAQVPCTPYHPPIIAGVVIAPVATVFRGEQPVLKVWDWGRCAFGQRIL